MVLFLVEFNRESGEPDWRVYKEKGHARAAITLASKRHSRWHDDALGATMYVVDMSGLHVIEEHGRVGPEQDPLF